MNEGAPARAGAREVLRDRSVSALLTSQLLFTAVHAILATAIGKQVYDLTGRPLDLGLIGLAEFLPSALLVLVTGTVADRFDKRRVAAAALALELGTAAALAWYASTDPTAVGPMFAFAGMLGL
ncbi:MAG: MFS transporter, partial [Acidimicrobiales bacterium]|nr:MFS transporter [Acidimicrobiales bacterium]